MDWLVTALTALMLTGPASAETPNPTPPPAVVATAAPREFAQLSPGNRRTATALFEAQKTAAPKTERLTLDEIARERRSGKSWGEIFRSMKSQGLIQAESLSQVLGRHDRARYVRS